MSIRLKYWKYSATGNTFLIFNNLQKEAGVLKGPQLAELAKIYHVDGFLFLEPSNKDGVDFHMRYLNADGGEVEMCGNGARSIIHFADQIAGLRPAVDETFQFSTLNSIYSGKAKPCFPLQMTEIKDWELLDISDLLESNFTFYLNTGVPHAIFEVKGLKDFDVFSHGKRVRYDRRFENGINANFFEILREGEINLRTYERGVEDETQSCGTGATATALALAKVLKWSSPIKVNVRGGELKVSFDKDFSKVYLEGPVELLEEGLLNI